MAQNLNNREPLQLEGEEVTDPLTSPFKKLIQAVVIRAIQDLFDSDKENRKNAYGWFIDSRPNLEDVPFSFPWCLRELGFSACAEKFRKKILTLTEEDIQTRNNVVTYNDFFKVKRVKRKTASHPTLKTFRVSYR